MVEKIDFFEGVKSHFESLEVKIIEVPEWGDGDGKPLKIYCKPITLREMKRFMQIAPNPEQVVINEEQLVDNYSTDDLNENNFPILGPHPEELFSNKKFKIRLTSKHTGKKIDVNIQFGKKIK